MWLIWHVHFSHGPAGLFTAEVDFDFIGLGFQLRFILPQAQIK